MTVDECTMAQVVVSQKQMPAAHKRKMTPPPVAVTPEKYSRGRRRQC